MSSRYLCNGRYRLELDDRASGSALAQRLCVFLAPYFVEVNDEGHSIIDLTVRLHDSAAFRTEWVGLCVTPRIIRETYAPGFTLRVLCGHDPQTALDNAWDPDTRVGYRIDRARRCVDFYGDDNAFIHLIELVRYFGLLVEQAKGSVVMHASAVVGKDGGIVAIGGAKGAGKTTTMLDLVLSDDYLYFSGDKLLLDVVDGRVRARGWPDYPHVGVGTLRTHPELARRLDLASVADDPSIANTEKRLCMPEAMRAALKASPEGSGWLTTVMLPNVGERGTLRVYTPERDTILEQIHSPTLFEWPHRFITSTWHGMIDPAALTDTVPAQIVEGLLDVQWQNRVGVTRELISA
ncbi:hypothetical protein A584_03560 [Pseudomonas syringae pv. theae ICMP 3923]|uniref:Uncharacterized protein n=3 Tax=Pseudomonas syringae group TaxID=136849 RepID=A0A261WHU5_9PSED|nr:hypothetical protein [Pseudomonas syringae]OZI85667.1 hypothetical protein CFN58_16570 [Pseudomonas avellanae]ATV18222.1 hypothetical protein CT122_16290 [Pseudomonas syringae pv. actinidiae]EPM58498.1 hypothetical protein A262_12787 [Pseudomonas syringae pv. actinidiae ICMP 19073]EPM59245.1 hypothetical protein A264_14676 [Pseudomonas syringae pv. actinidiae ICMP 19071]EPM72781.1 hypothetical protein A584_03560 [Pseudomonas syringae pv. theae ICMP 3923]